jgi:cytochrome-b5 reductase
MAPAMQAASHAHTADTQQQPARQSWPPAAGSRQPGCRMAALEYASACVVPTTWEEYPLLSVQAYNHDTSIFEFGLEPEQSLGLPVCGCILMLAPGQGPDGQDEVRPYTPISDNSMLGRFQLLVKRYPAWGEPHYPMNYKPPGAVSNYIHSLEPGAKVNFKHIKFNLKLRYPFVGVRTITMLAVGVGIAPMLQALHCLLTTADDHTRIVFLYGNRATRDILMRERLDEWAKAHEGRLKLVYCIGTRWKAMHIGAAIGGAPPGPPEGMAEINASPNPAMAVEGWVDEAKVKQFGFPPAADTKVFVCGLPSVYASLCGPRGEKGLAEGSVLQRLGYTQEMVFKF